MPSLFSFKTSSFARPFLAHDMHRQYTHAENTERELGHEQQQHETKRNEALKGR